MCTDSCVAVRQVWLSTQIRISKSMDVHLVVQICLPVSSSLPFDHTSKQVWCVTMVSMRNMLIDTASIEQLISFNVYTLYLDAGSASQCTAHSARTVQALYVYPLITCNYKLLTVCCTVTCYVSYHGSQVGPTDRALFLCTVRHRRLHRPTRKAFPEKITKYIWLTLSYVA